MAYFCCLPIAPVFAIAGAADDGQPIRGRGTQCLCAGGGCKPSPRNDLQAADAAFVGLSARLRALPGFAPKGNCGLPQCMRPPR